MNFTTRLSLKSFTAGFALLAVPFGYSQIPEAELESIFERLNGADFDVRYEARMDLQDHVSLAGKPGNEEQIAPVESQLLARLDSEPLLTTKLWILRQLSSIGSEASVPALRELMGSDDDKLADGARMALSRIAPSDPVNDQLPTKAAELERILNGDSNRAKKSAAFAKLSEVDSGAAAQVLEEALASDSVSAGDYLKIAMGSSSRSLRSAALSKLEQLDVKHQIVILGALEKRASSKLERQIISLLQSENETLKLQAVEALGRVGTVRSLDSVLELTRSRDRDLSSAAADTLAAIEDKRIDRNLLRSAKRGTVEDRIIALNALRYRATEGVTELVNEMAANASLDERLREAAIEAMEFVGNLESLPVLVNIVVEEDSGLRRDAQKVLKRMTLRTNDPDAAWSAFEQGLANSSNDKEATLALLLILDSAPSASAIERIKLEWTNGDEDIRKTILRVLPSWRNWDGGYLLLDMAKTAGDDEALVNTCVKGIARIILGSDANYPIEDKYELASAALELTSDTSARSAILNAFRNADWKDRRYLDRNEVNPELEEKVLSFIGG